MMSASNYLNIPVSDFLRMFPEHRKHIIRLLANSVGIAFSEDSSRTVTLHLEGYIVSVPLQEFKFSGKEFADSVGFRFRDPWIESSTIFGYWLLRYHPDASMDDILGIFSSISTASDELTLLDVANICTHYMNSKYPPPLENVVYSFNRMTMKEKDYYLPALKLMICDGAEGYYSPTYISKWDNMELLAMHMHHNSNRIVSDEILHCSCGIYGTTHLEELDDYRNPASFLKQHFRGDPQYVLCLIEPCPESTLYLARKGWKTNHAFISEIVGETISVEDASELLSMVWNRKMDIRAVYEQITKEQK